jgi:hypothetical protein
MCDESRSAGTVRKTVKELKKIGREHPSNWQTIVDEYGEDNA